MRLAAFVYLIILALIVLGFVFLPIWTGSVITFFAVCCLRMIHTANKAPIIQDEEMNF